MISRLRLLAVAFVSLVAVAAPALAADKAVRLAIVNTPKMSGLIDDLIADYKSTGGSDVTVYSGSDVYDRARAGEADLVVSHYGAPGVESFVSDGFGLWPRTVFSNVHAIIGPKNDPAGIRGLTSASEALKKIAAAKALFAVNNLHGISYLSNILWLQAGSPEKGDWYLNPGLVKGQAMKFADEKQAYTIWGAVPFLRFKEKHGSTMDILVTADPLLQRMMAAILVNPQKVSGLNTEGAKAFQSYLLSERAQARVAAYRTPGSEAQLWWPAGRHNSAEGLEE